MTTDYTADEILEEIRVADEAASSRIDSLLDLGRAMERIFEVRLRDLNCSPTQLRIMEGVAAAHPALESHETLVTYRDTPSALAAGVLQQPHSISGLLNRLEEQRFIKRTVDSLDKRAVHVSLTPKGELLLHQAGEIRRRLEVEVREIQHDYFLDDWAEQILTLDEWQKKRGRG